MKVDKKYYFGSSYLLQIMPIKSFVSCFILIISEICCAQVNWSVGDLNVTNFRNGDELLEVNTEANWKFCNTNQIPAYYKLGKSLNDGVLYNYYALKDERQLAPVGYRIPNLEDVKALNVLTGLKSENKEVKSNSLNVIFNTKGYISNEAYDVLSSEVAGYYWTNTLGSALKTWAFVFLQDEKGLSLEELRRESFCAVRCIKNENEAEAFEKNEKNLIAEQNRQMEQRLFAEQRAKKEAEDKKLANEKAKKELEDRNKKEAEKKNAFILGTPSNGQLMVYIASDIGCGNIDVMINGITKTIKSFYSDNEPDCNAIGCATFSLPPGEYQVTASCKGLKWSFTKTVTSNGCTKVKLGGKGELMFWVTNDLGCGQIDVTINGETKTISNFHSSEPDCNAIGCATFSLVPGEYKVTASCNGLKWSFTKTIESDKCIKTKLINSK